MARYAWTRTPLISRVRLSESMRRFCSASTRIVGQQSGIAHDSIETALQRFRDRMLMVVLRFLTLRPCNGSAATYLTRDNLHNSPAMGTGRGYFAACSVKLTKRWKTPVKAFFKRIGILLKRRVILTRSKRVVTQRCGDVLKTRSRPSMG
jgi:hypothetical protein